ncbi:MAG: SDR family oxidoreductase [Solirubrobacteraceae bacterium]|nr:SDR family oxidoreductase [Solirubrobacteraceae bacterium]
MTGMLEGKVAVIVGGAGEIGGGIASVLAAHGARVAVVDAAAGDRDVVGHITRRFDVEQADSHSAGELVASITEELGPVDVLVHNAHRRGVGDFLAVEPDELRRVIAVDARGPLLMGQAVGRELVRRGAPGRLIIVNSAASLRAVPRTTAHALAGAMAATLAQVAAVELAPHGITVNVVAAGWLRSSFLDCVDGELALSAIPAGRIGEPEELGEVCAFLASDASGYVSGAVIPVDGGYAVTKSPGGTPIRSSCGEPRDSIEPGVATPRPARISGVAEGGAR